MTKSITSFIVILISAAFGFFYVKPAYDLVQGRRSEVASLSNILSSSSKIQTLIDQTTENLEGVSSTELARFAVFLPETIDDIRFANNLQHIGLINGIVLQGIKVKATSDDKQSKQSDSAGTRGAQQGVVRTFSLESKIQQSPIIGLGVPKPSAPAGKKYTTTKASFSFSATYESFRLFLNDLERSLSLVSVTSLIFTPIAETTDAKKLRSVAPAIYQYVIEIETYSLNPTSK